ncbi:excisionase [Massilia sp. Leaf139]|nr:excisionase [Massilia sp. Leaf139]
MGSLAIHVEWVLLPMFCALTGYTEKAVRRKIEDGVWLQSKHFRKAPDGRITMNVQEYYKWVEQAA